MIRIMVVDDEHDVESLFQAKIQERNKRRVCVDFHFTFSGEDALEYLNTAKAADLVLILSDINMPGMNGS